MMPGTVVPAAPAVSEQQFHTSVAAGILRAERAIGSRKGVAFVMDLSVKQVGNVLAGAATDPKRLWDLRAAVPTALDDVADLYGCRIVAKDAVCTGDGKLSQVTCALLKKAIDAEMDGIIDHREKLDMEHELRGMRHLIDQYLEEIGQLRSPRVVNG